MGKRLLQSESGMVLLIGVLALFLVTALTIGVMGNLGF